jgi:hypothetical protein
MPPRRVRSELEYSLGTSPTYAIRARGDVNRSMPFSSAITVSAVTVSMPRKHRSHPTGSRNASPAAALKSNSRSSKSEKGAKEAGEERQEVRSCIWAICAVARRRFQRKSLRVASEIQSIA